MHKTAIEISSKQQNVKLTDLPVLVCVTDDKLKDCCAADSEIYFTDQDGNTLLCEIKDFQKQTGQLNAWIILPEFTGSATIQLCCGDSQKTDKDRHFWDEHFKTVITKATEKPIQLPHDTSMDITEQITVEAWVDATNPRAESLQALVSKWQIPDSFTVENFAAYDAGNTDGLKTMAYFGAVFDGRYVYFSPEQLTTETYHGVVLRYDTHGDFKDPKSYSAYDAGFTDGINTKGFYGAIFDGRYVVFIPRENEEGYHSHFLQFDATGDFKDPKSWSAFDAGQAHSQQSAAFDGRYIYCCPGFSGSTEKEDSPSGEVIRVDTLMGPKDPAAYTSFDVSKLSPLAPACFDGANFDGRYIYFAAHNATRQATVRYDTTGDFHDEKNWQVFDGSKIDLGLNVGIIFDGRYNYYAAYAHGNICRFDTTEKDFTKLNAWSCFNACDVDGLKYPGYDGCFFDGKYIYFVPFVAQVAPGTPGSHENKDRACYFHGEFLRYDSTKPFEDTKSWQVCDSANTDGLKSFGYNAGAFDGRFFYCAPWQQGRGYLVGPGHLNIHGNVLRLDTTGDKASFSLRYCDCGTNGGLTAAVPGANFIINTETGPVSIAANKALKPGKHHLVGTYDGKKISLYIDGKLAGQRHAPGRIQKNDSPLVIGKIQAGKENFTGSVLNVTISDIDRGSDWVKVRYENLSNPEQFTKLID